jgi:hypothetical protein
MKSHTHETQIIDLGEARAATRGADLEGPVDLQTLMKVRQGDISDED